MSTIRATEAFTELGRAAKEATAGFTLLNETMVAWRNHIKRHNRRKQRRAKKRRRIKRRGW